jgi:hypothetical protein
MKAGYADAAHTATWMNDNMRATEVLYRTTPQTAYLANQIFGATAQQIAGTPMREPFEAETVGRAMQSAGRWAHDLVQTVNVVAARLLWQKARITYSVDPDLWQELGRTAPDDKLPSDLFAFLPHPDPCLVFPDPIVLPVGGGKEQQRVVCVFVHGRATPHAMGGEFHRVNVSGSGSNIEHIGELHVSTSAAECTGISLSFAGLVETPAGHPVNVSGVPGLRDVIWTHTSLNFSDGDTFGDLVAGAISRFGRSLAPGTKRDHLPSLISQAVGALVYLCCQNADLRPIPARPARSAKGGGKATKAKPPKVIQIGYRVGPQLRAYRRHHTDGGGQTGRTVAPHVRRAHAHTYRHGPGRQQKRVLWLHPILVGVGGGGMRETTVIPVAKT